MSALKDWMDSWPLPEGEPFPGETLRADGWVYRDLPRMTPDAMEKFLGIVGTEEVRWLTRASYPDGSTRGQLLISPQGMENMKAWTAANSQ
jgi:hypothetical protein